MKNIFQQDKENDIMEYRTLGKTGLKISRMGFGGIPIQKIDEKSLPKIEFWLK